MKIVNNDYNNMELDLTAVTLAVNSTTLVTGMTTDLVDKINSLAADGVPLLFRCTAKVTGENPEIISVVLLPTTSTGTTDDARWYGRCYFNGSDRNILVTFTAPQTVYLLLS